MATQTKPNTAADNAEAAVKKAGNVYLDLYEKTLNSIADLQDKVGEQSRVEWVSTLANAQANFTRELATAYTSAARTVLK